MGTLDRRAFLSVSAGGLSAIVTQTSAFAAPAACVTGALPRFLPNRLTVGCGSRQNFALFRQNSKFLGLAGVVNMTVVQGRYGTFEAGNLFLYPWVKPAAKAAGRHWTASAPTATMAAMQLNPIPGDTLPLDEYLCRIVMELPAKACIGFSVDGAHKKGQLRGAWASNVDKLAGNDALNINWSSAGLNASWFGGSRWIPDGDTCDGKAWRQLIVDGLKQAAAPAC